MEVVEYTVQISALPDSDKCASQRSYKRYPMQISAQANAAISIWFVYISICQDFGVCIILLMQHLLKNSSIRFRYLLIVCLNVSNFKFSA